MTTRANTIPAIPTRRRGFTLIELLTVIAIIAILLAIILPALFTAKEAARQKQSMSNMHAIQSALASYDLDHHHYPPVLFGYAVPAGSGGCTPGTNGCPAVPMNEALQQAKELGNSVTNVDAVVAQYFPGIYPEYIRPGDEDTFRDPNNTANVGDSTTVTAQVNVVNDTTGDLTTGTQTFYQADSYDASPLITGENKIDTSTYVDRYQTSWTGWPSSGWATDMGTLDSADCGNSSSVCTPYSRQLRFRVPPGDTVVTATTWHVPNNGKVLVLWLDGPAKAYDVTRFLGTGTESFGVSSGANGPANAVNTDPMWLAKK
jgi:prepilin-type N-terminal cleavage/methylation domain-containing protein